MTLQGLDFLVKKFRINEEQCATFNCEYDWTVNRDRFVLDVSYYDGSKQQYKFYYKSLRSAGLYDDDVISTEREPIEYLDLVEYLEEEDRISKEHRSNIERDEKGNAVIRFGRR